MKRLHTLLTAACLLVLLSPQSGATSASPLIRHVLLISVDGMHAADLDQFIRTHPHSALTELAARGVDYTNAHTPAPADSFPGLLAIMTGGTPAATGVYFDVSYDRSLAASAADCHANRFGAVVAFDEAADAAPDAHGKRQLDPARLPRRPGSCTPVYPHDYLRSNTVFEVVHAAGGHTAWIDKHPVYEILSGPSGAGIDDLYTPEIGGDFEGTAVKPADHITGSIARTERYDADKARALLNQIDGWRHDRSRRAPVPTLFGMNLQAVNVAQKLAGYADAKGTPSAALAEAMTHSDALIGQMVHALRAHDLLDSTLIVVTAKHGNAPLDSARVRHVEKQRLRDTIGTAAAHGLAQLTADHGGLIWLHDPNDAAQVAMALEQAKVGLGLARVLQGAQVAAFFKADPDDSRLPDLLLLAQDGVIYGKPDDSKLAEHGGFGEDDTHVGLLLSNPHLAGQGRQVATPVSTTQLAPSMLIALHLGPRQLRAVVAQHVEQLPGLFPHGR